MGLGIYLYALGSFWSTAAFNAGLILGLLGFIIQSLVRREKIFWQSSLNKGILLFFAAGFLSLLYAAYPGEVLGALKEYALVFASYYMFLNFFAYQPNRVWTERLLFFSASLAAAYGIIQHFMGMERVIGTLNYMTYAELMMIIALISFDYCLKAKRVRNQRIYAAVFLLTAAALLFTMTRAAWIGFLAALALYIFCYQRKKLIWLVVAVVLIIFLVPGISGRVQTISDLQMQSNAERLKIWTSTSQMVKDYPLTGIGLGNFPERYQQEYILDSAQERNLRHAHSSYLNFLAETGIIGFLCFLFLLCLMLKEGWLCREKNAVFFALLAFAVQGLVEFNFDDDKTLLLLLLFLAAGTCQERRGNK